MVFDTDYGSSEPLKTLVMLCYVMPRIGAYNDNEAKSYDLINDFIIESS